MCGMRWAIWNGMRAEKINCLIFRQCPRFGTYKKDQWCCYQLINQERLSPDIHKIYNKWIWWLRTVNDFDWPIRRTWSGKHGVQVPNYVLIRHRNYLFMDSIFQMQRLSWRLVRFRAIIVNMRDLCLKDLDNTKLCKVTIVFKYIA